MPVGRIPSREKCQKLPARAKISICQLVPARLQVIFILAPLSSEPAAAGFGTPAAARAFSLRRRRQLGAALGSEALG